MVGFFRLGDCVQWPAFATIVAPAERDGISSARPAGRHAPLEESRFQPPSELKSPQGPEPDELD
jgi:hypothetical protein